MKCPTNHKRVSNVSKDRREAFCLDCWNTVYLQDEDVITNMREPRLQGKAVAVKQ